jgi:hypothetical protein
VSVLTEYLTEYSVLRHVGSCSTDGCAWMDATKMDVI